MFNFDYVTYNPSKSTISPNHKQTKHLGILNVIEFVEVYEKCNLSE